ncbi:9450_t:CDS:2 [Ambispora gerdemannii]|uniref:9450_t:CDS:1 n=1 Tax=Ambispora gerdemannii TaxID=144530 RepID=A0A9N9FVP1_9GLOM|nr:9450_t:CDS:2 [Ambispora gerdemannii]
MTRNTKPSRRPEVWIDNRLPMAYDQQRTSGVRKLGKGNPLYPEKVVKTFVRSMIVTV